MNETETDSPIVAPDGSPARLPRLAKCPQCGAPPEQRVTTGMGPLQEVTCENCAYEFPKERAL